MILQAISPDWKTYSGIMECQIDISDAIEEYCSVLSRKNVKAAKEYNCYECHDVIAVGQLYERISYAYDGKISAHKTCLTCVEIRNSLFCNGYRFEGVWEDISESDYKPGFGDLIFLSPEAQKKLIEETIIKDPWFDEEEVNVKP